MKEEFDDMKYTLKTILRAVRRKDKIKKLFNLL